MQAIRGRQMNPNDTLRADPADTTYEPPAVETVMTADELAREIQYAGQPSSSDLQEV
jgi:hypothetical protein